MKRLKRYTLAGVDFASLPITLKYIEAPDGQLFDKVEVAALEDENQNMREVIEKIVNMLKRYRESSPQQPLTIRKQADEALFVATPYLKDAK